MTNELGLKLLYNT